MKSERVTRPTKIDWLRGLSLPAEWTESKVKYLAPGMQAGEAITAEAIEPSGTYPVYGGNGVRGYTESKTHCGTRILIGRQGALCGNVHLVSGEFWASEHAIVACPTEVTDPRWLAHLLRVMKLGQYSQAAAQPGIGTAQINALPVPLPPLEEQCAIADYLDRETARIDRLIEEQQCLLDMLRERREALIEGSLRASADTPIRLSRIARSRSGDVPPPLEEDGQYVVWGAGRVVGHTSQVNAQAGDLLVGRVGQGSVGKVRRLTEAAWATDNTIVLRLDSSVADPRYDEHGLRLIPRFELVGGGAMPLVTAERLLAQPVPFTALPRQHKVADYIEQETARIDLLAEETERFIDLSRERRVALITAAVTGQIDVREMA
jgi:type I restriction enzyme, S subunit